ncbi:MAG: DMT family transporter, partial [Actinobacteria bacterium]|nr:DMT family transporter [Actinomycetota bacterium]NIU69851.1 DMT family transporter [Actinomycetota bacterium]NIW31727.1 EamA family transporter [Actinomycetota bacterium]
RGVDLSGLQTAFWRTVLAAAVYAAALAAAGRRLSRRQLWLSAPAGLAIGAELGVFFIALKTTTIANATLIGALQPIVLLVFGARRFGERVSGRILGMSLIALGGVAMVVLGSTSQPIWSPGGDALAFAAMLLFAAYYVFAKRARAGVPAFEFQTAVWIWAGLLLLPAAAIETGGLDFPGWSTWLWLSTLVAVPGTGHLLMNWAHGRTRLTTAAVVSLGLPVLSTVGAAIFLSESITGWQYPGIVIVVVSLTAVIRRSNDVGGAADPPEGAATAPRPGRPA